MDTGANKILRNTARSERNRWVYFQLLWVSLFYFAFGIAPLLMSSCATGGNTMSTITLTQADKGKSITVHVGDEVIINLTENPTTGYRWAIDKTDDTILTSQSSTFSPTPSGAIGSGGTRTFTFTAKHPGTAHLQLKLLRPWLGDSSIIDRYDVSIHIQS